ncbi:IclR family transcription regulator (plasmid) [Natrialba magadii ATCC 43099]|uniref:IclR family transcription regulator n=1 Tax=Natrialba magadii (strain ATCC 43099 / DSM 3394 / CCM 3739 / CIP 104546 / IAM 13178 / JCM 8861 / NBRC 102185 / NCIMB 2190 / MS3) TaxID=547559 RepID=D3T1M2_NATMM|nr:IclR family transcriptional regulator [Natrialba magadii]ADD07481.1 IclR family transcription regulator [Natrialba magadii ATCC 43099]ELY32199.1 IclR family transcriptional regulator [Natrialba magadii ATCC 43099]
MSHNTEAGGGIRATETTFALIETLAERDHARLTELATAVGIANSTASEHLATLKANGYVVEDDEGYRLGLKFMDIGVRAKRHYDGLLECAEPVLEQLVEETGETIGLLARENKQAVYVDRRVGEQGVPTNAWVGKRKPMHTMAAGKVMLAYLSADQRDEIIEGRGLPAVTAQTITTREELEAELETARDRGVAFNDCESHERVRGVAAPIVLQDEVYGAVAVAGPARRLTETYFREELPNLLLGAANEIELKLTYH